MLGSTTRKRTQRLYVIPCKYIFRVPSRHKQTQTQTLINLRMRLEQLSLF